MKKLLALILLLPSLVSAQGTVRADRFTFITGPCTMRSGSGAPSSGLGVLCDTYIDTATGILWLKQAGGWVVSGVTGTGTADVVSKWTTSTNLGNSTITDTSGGNMTLAPAGDLITNPTGNDILPTTNYDINIGSPSLKYLGLHIGELFAETLVAQDVMSTIGGRITVAPTTLLTGDLSTGATTMVVKHNNLSNGDRVLLMTSPGGVPQVEFIAVTSGASGSAGAYSYSVTRNLDGTGANQWYAGDAILNTGQTGNGFIDLYSTRGIKAGTEVGPTIVGNVRLSSTYNDWAPRWAIGNLDGLYNYSGSTYGAAFGQQGGARITVEATNGIRIYGSDNDEKVTIDLSGNATFDGKLTVGTGRNMIRNSECRVGTEDWTTGASHAVPLSLGFALASYRLSDQTSTCYIGATGTPANNETTDAKLTGQPIPVTAGIRYEMSAYLGILNSTSASIFVQWLDSGGSTISFSTGANACTSSGGLDLADFCRSGLIATAPSTSRTAIVWIRVIHSGGTNPFLFWVRSYFGEASTTQEDLTEWGPAGITEITGGMIKTDAIDARTIVADAITASEIQAGAVTASKISVSTLSAITANVGTLTSGTIDGVEVRAGSGDEVVLNSSGVTFTAGTGGNNSVKWSDGSAIRSNSDTLNLISDSSINLLGSGSGTINIDVPSGTILLDSSTVNVSVLGSGTSRFVCHNNGDLYSSITQCDGATPEVVALRQEIAELREQVRQLMALIPGAKQ